MINMPLTELALLAEQGAEGGAPKGGFDLLFILPWIAIGLLFYFMLMRPQRTEQRRRQDMLSAVKKNDRVLTAGGIYGVVTSVRPEADEVTVKVDETNNTKLRMTLSSIARVLGDESAEDTSKASPKA